MDKAAWDAHHSKPPRLFDGTSFDQTPAPNRFGLAPFYSQHVWIWKNNPAGVLADVEPAGALPRLAHRIARRDAPPHTPEGRTRRSAGAQRTRPAEPPARRPRHAPAH